MPKRQATPQSQSILARMQRLSAQLLVNQETAIQFLLTFYIQEAFMLRLLKSQYQEYWTLGGSQRLYREPLLQGHVGARPTQDIDFRHDQALSLGDLEKLVALILQEEVDDGVTFEPKIEVSPILAKTQQKGLRVRVDGYVGVARATLWCDVSFGAPLVPGREQLALPRLLQPKEVLLIGGYSTESVLAGKIAALLERGNLDSRAKDFYDVWWNALHRDFEGVILRAALVEMCTYQGVEIDPEAQAFASESFASDVTQLRQWERFISRLGIQSAVPSFAEALEKVRALYGPVLRGEVEGKRWDYMTQHWE